jgi:hypothetical protein
VAENGLAYEILDIELDPDTEDIYLILKTVWQSESNML